MKTMFNLTTSSEDMDGFDGVELMQFEDDIQERISHVVVMGIGEPFDNYDNIMNFVKIINDPKGIDIGARHITISTCGIVPKIKEFSKDFNQVNLAISLHAPNDTPITSEKYISCSIKKSNTPDVKIPRLAPPSNTIVPLIIKSTVPFSFP